MLQTMEQSHTTLNPYIKTPHPNIWIFMTYIKYIISDIDLELQRLKASHDTTSTSNSVTKAKTERRNECKDRFLNGFLSANEYLIAISLTIGREDYNL